MHQMAASFLAVPELAIDADEAHLLADAVAEVSRLYNFMPDPKTQAWINLGMVAGAVYGPRIYVLTHKPAPAKPNIGDNITQFSPSQSGDMVWPSVPN